MAVIGYAHTGEPITLDDASEWLEYLQDHTVNCEDDGLEAQAYDAATSASIIEALLNKVLGA